MHLGNAKNSKAEQALELAASIQCFCTSGNVN